jgi:hypothetical protein
MTVAFATEMWHVLLVSLETALNVGAAAVGLILFVLAVQGRPVEHRTRSERIVIAVIAVVLTVVLMVVIQSRRGPAPTILRPQPSSLSETRDPKPQISDMVQTDASSNSQSATGLSGKTSSAANPVNASQLQSTVDHAIASNDKLSYVSLPQQRIASSKDGNVILYIGETPERILLRVVGKKGWWPSVTVDLNENGRDDYRLDFSYHFSGVKPDITSSVSTNIGRWTSTGAFKSKGDAHARKIADWTYEYVWYVPKTEISLSGSSASLSVGAMSLQEISVEDIRTSYQFRWPVKSTSINEHRAAYPALTPG